MVNNIANPNNIYDSFIKHHISKPEIIKTKNTETEILICTKMYGINFVNVIPTLPYCYLQRRSKTHKKKTCTDFAFIVIMPTNI